MHDTDALISHNLVRRNVPNVFVTTELLDSETVKYIHHDMIPGALEVHDSSESPLIRHRTSCYVWGYSTGRAQFSFRTVLPTSTLYPVLYTS